MNGSPRPSALGSRLSGLHARLSSGWELPCTLGLVTFLAAFALLTSAAGAQPSAEGRAPLVPVAARALARGAVLADADIALVPPATVRGAAPSARPAAAGWTTRRAVAAGEALREPTVAPPGAVAAGQAVDLVWRDGDLELRLRGVAANAAPLGGRVAVRVGRRRFDGIAAGAALVRLPGDRP